MSATPYVTFEPEWTAIAGPLRIRGKGIIGKSMPIAQRPLIDVFKVNLGTHSVTVEPKAGRISFDSTVVLQLSGTAELCWSRTMEKDFQVGMDTNSEPFHCAFYKLGLEQNGNKHGWRIFSDERMVKGI